jgi:hypothetical protein
VRNEGVIYGDAEYGNQSLSKICMHNAIILNFSCLVSLVGLSHRRLQHVGQSMTPEKGVEERRPPPLMGIELGLGCERPG